MLRPPSFRTLRAFEAAARFQSFSRAAGELGLTHSAISHRIREAMAIKGPDEFARCHFPRNSWHPWTLWFQKAGLALQEPSDSRAYDVPGRCSKPRLPAMHCARAQGHCA